LQTYFDDETTLVDEALQRASDCARRGASSPVILSPSAFSPASTARLDEASSSKSDSIEANLLVIPANRSDGRSHAQVMGRI